MDIHSAESHIQKVNQFLTEVLESDPRMYTRTREKFAQLSSDMYKGIETISKILLDSSLVDEQEFDPENTNCKAVLHALRENSANSLAAISRVDEFVSQPDISLKKRKFIVAKYGSVLRALSQVDSPYSVVNECMKLLWRWYEIRFFNANNIFHYNIRRFPQWLKCFVIAYGSAVKHDAVEEFKTRINAWLNDVAMGKDNKYAVPYEIYQLTQSISPEDASVEAIMIWEVMFDLGLNALSNKELAECSLNSETIYNTLSSIDSEIFNRYVYYHDDDSLLRGER